MKYNTLLIGGRGNIGAGLRTYLPNLNPGYQFISIDLPGAADKAIKSDTATTFVDGNIIDQPDILDEMLTDIDLVVYLARHGDLTTMNKMTDLVFEIVLSQKNPPMIIGSSSVHAVDGAYHFFRKGVYGLIAERRFDDIKVWPDRLSASMPACPINPYGEEKAYVEQWVERAAGKGCGAVAMRWGGVNARNTPLLEEVGYFSVWCHQEDAARCVHAAYQAYLNGSLPDHGAHYFVISNNTYNIFDIETPRREIGYEPQYNAENYVD